MADPPGRSNQSGRGDAPPPRWQALRPAERLKRRPEFQRVFAEGLRTHGRFFTVFVLPNTLGRPRLGIVASRKFGNAVRRNRAKRLIREVFRRNKPEPPVDLVVIPRREMLDAPYATLEADYHSILRRRGVRSRPRTEGDTG